MTPAPARSAAASAPTFVLAPARSYTSVVATMIGQHPQCASLPELKLFAYPTIGELEDSLPRYWSERGFTHRSPGLVRAISEFEFAGQSPESLLRARAWLRDRSHWSGANIFDVLLERLYPRIPVEKSPENVMTDAALELLSSSFPQARYLHLTRHPVTTQRSMQEHISRTVPEIVAHGQPISGLASWVETHCRILRFASTLPPNRYLRLKAEDVLNDPCPKLLSIAEWLALRADRDAIDAMMHPERSPFAKFGPADTGLIGGHDHNFLRDPIPHRVEVMTTLEPPEGCAADSPLWNMTVDIANRLGYP